MKAKAFSIAIVKNVVFHALGGILGILPVFVAQREAAKGNGVL